jgi:hypothetical protein
MESKAGDALGALAVTSGQFLLEEMHSVQNVLVFKRVMIEGIIGCLRDPGCVSNRHVSGVFEAFWSFGEMRAILRPGGAIHFIHQNEYLLVFGVGRFISDTHLLRPCQFHPDLLHHASEYKNNQGEQQESIYIVFPLSLFS